MTQVREDEQGHDHPAAQVTHGCDCTSCASEPVPVCKFLCRPAPTTLTGVKERIQKVLANAGVASRRAVEEMIQQGRVAVNGRVMTDLPILIDPAKDKVSVDDEPVRLKGKEAERRVYLLMNKPKGVFSTNVAQG